jgi:signal transduction histidine kinase
MSDTGHGMDSAVLERIFDPYLTTKWPGKRTSIQQENKGNLFGRMLVGILESERGV